MTSLLCGEGSPVFLRELAGVLRERTRRRAEELDRQSHDHYTPWLSLRPMLNEPLNPELADMEYRQGELIIDEQRLGLIDDWLRGTGRAVVDDMPVVYDDWPVMIEIERNRPDAIAAFHEGRALLAASPFLDDLYEDLVDVVVPQDRVKPSGFDSAFARGAVFRTFPEGRTGLLAGFQLAHAMGHQAAMLLQSVDPIFDAGRFDFIDYAVRDDQRTADHAFVSAVAVAYTAMLSHAIYGRVARPYIADDHVSGYGETLGSALGLAIDSIRSSSSRVTEVGAQALDELESLV